MLPASSTRVLIMGQGYIGLPLSMLAIEAGYEVVGYDVDAKRIGRLQAASSYIEDIDDVAIEKALATGLFHPTTDATHCAGFDFAVITVPTPLRDRLPDLSFVESAGRTAGEHLKPGACIVLESTTYPGTTEELLVPILEQASGLIAGKDFFVGFSPERVDPGNRDWQLHNTPKVISGINYASLQHVQRFYASLVERTVPVTSTKVAELSKLIENTYRHVNIALVNELAMFAADLDIDIWEAIDAASTKPYGFMRFTPGPGVGGHCLPIDPSYLSWHVQTELDTSFRFVELANDINAHMPAYTVRRLQDALNKQKLPLNGSRILLLGLAYKKNSSDARHAPAIDIARQLLDAGSDVVGCDPHVSEDLIVEIPRVQPTIEEVRNAHAVVLLTDHDEFDYQMIVQHARYIFDTRHRFIAGTTVEHL